MNMSKPAEKMIIVIIVLAVALTAVGVVLCLTLDYFSSDDALPYALGLLLTSALNVLKVFIIEKQSQRIMKMENPKTGKHYVTFQYFIRYILTGLVLVAAALIPFIGLWGAIIGVLTMQIAAFSIKFMRLD